jgi:hypothetical protein
MTTRRFPPPWPVHGRIGMTIERAKIDRVCGPSKQFIVI